MPLGRLGVDRLALTEVATQRRARLVYAGALWRLLTGWACRRRSVIIALQTPLQQAWGQALQERLMPALTARKATEDAAAAAKAPEGGAVGSSAEGAPAA